MGEETHEAEMAEGELGTEGQEMDRNAIPATQGTLTKYKLRHVI